MNDPDYEAYMVVWRRGIKSSDFELPEEECCDKLCDDEKVGLVVEVDTDQIIDSLIMNHGMQYVTQFVKDLSVAMESVTFDVEMYYYFSECVRSRHNKGLEELREW